MKTATTPNECNDSERSSDDRMISQGTNAATLLYQELLLERERLQKSIAILQTSIETYSTRDRAENEPPPAGDASPES